MALTLSGWAADVGAGVVEATRRFDWPPFLGPFHAVVLHLPIGFLMMGALLELYSLRRPSEDLKRIVRLVILVGGISGAVAAGFGIAQASGGGYDSKTVELHRWFGLSVPAAAFLTLAVQHWAYRKAAAGLVFGYRACLLGTVSLLMIAGHFGGNLTHGAGYLVENAPTFIKDLLGSPPPAAAHQAVAQDAPQRLYVDKVEPIFKAKCYACHGPEKQKGGFRLDDPVRARQGGESGEPGVKPGDVIGSHLAKLILLPPDHDDVMPPSSKGQLTPDELMSILQWIRTGAVVPSAKATSP